MAPDTELIGVATFPIHFFKYENGVYFYIASCCDTRLSPHFGLIASLAEIPEDALGCGPAADPVTGPVVEFGAVQTIHGSPIELETLMGNKDIGNADPINHGRPNLRINPDEVELISTKVVTFVDDNRIQLFDGRKFRLRSFNFELSPPPGTDVISGAVKIAQAITTKIVAVQIKLENVEKSAAFSVGQSRVNEGRLVKAKIEGCNDKVFVVDNVQ
jgi:hypothetical protein